jgi:hypothetical protein
MNINHFVHPVFYRLKACYRQDGTIGLDHRRDLRLHFSRDETVNFFFAIALQAILFKGEHPCLTGNLLQIRNDF